MRALHRRLGAYVPPPVLTATAVTDSLAAAHQPSQELVSGVNGAKASPVKIPSSSTSSPSLSHRSAAVDVDEQPLYPAGMTYKEWVRRELDNAAAAAKDLVDQDKKQQQQREQQQRSPQKTYPSPVKINGGGGSGFVQAVNVAGVNVVSRATAVASAAALAAHPLVTAPLGFTLSAVRAVKRLRANVTSSSSLKRPARTSARITHHIRTSTSNVVCVVLSPPTKVA